MERFILQPSQEPGFWVATDTENGVVIKFKDHEFNDTQKVTTLEDEDPEDYMLMARAMREIGEWLVANHPDKVF